MPQSCSLLRYPGGKTFFAPFLKELLDSNGRSDCAYVEPFAGSAGAALKLLIDGHVSSIVLGDIDPVVCTFWKLVLKSPSTLRQFIEKVELSVTEWQRQRNVYFETQASPEEKALAFFYLNRTNRSGVLSAGPIGGKMQSGDYGIDARFNREGLIKRLEAIQSVEACITFQRSNAISLCRSIEEKARAGGKFFIYLDPPYFKWGKELYSPIFSEKQHRNLANCLEVLGQVPWVLSCDNTSEAHTAYANFVRTEVNLRYSIHKHRLASELLVSPHSLSALGSAIDHRFPKRQATGASSAAD